MILFASSLVSACGAIKIKDGEWCGDMGINGASCFHTLSDETRDIPDREQWDQERFGMVCATAETFADLKIAIAKLCKRTKCTYEVKRQLQAFFSRVEKIQADAAMQSSFDSSGTMIVERLSQ